MKTQYVCVCIRTTIQQLDQKYTTVEFITTV